MCATAVARALVLIAVVLASGGAQGQPPTPQLTPPGRDDPTRVMREAEKYQNVCHNLRTKGSAALDPSLQKPFFREAISGFCAYGEFILSGGTFKPAENAAGSCTERETLNDQQLLFIRNLETCARSRFHKSDWSALRCPAARCRYSTWMAAICCCEESTSIK